MYNRLKPGPRQCALLLLRGVEERNSRGKSTMRLRVTLSSLKRICNRERLTTGFVEELGEWLLAAGWCLVDTGKLYGLVRTKAVADWPRLGTAGIKEEIVKTRESEDIFAALERLWPEEDAGDDDVAAAGEEGRPEDDAPAG